MGNLLLLLVPEEHESLGGVGATLRRAGRVVEEAVHEALVNLVWLVGSGACFLKKLADRRSGGPAAGEHQQNETGCGLRKSHEFYASRGSGTTLIFINGETLFLHVFILLLKTAIPEAPQIRPGGFVKPENLRLSESKYIFDVFTCLRCTLHVLRHFTVLRRILLLFEAFFIS